MALGSNTVHEKFSLFRRAALKDQNLTDLKEHAYATIKRISEDTTHPLQIDALTVAGEILHELLDAIPIGREKVELRIVVCDPFSKALDRRTELEEIVFREKESMRSRVISSAQKIQTHLSRLKIDSASSFRFLDALPAHFMMRINEELYFHPYLNTQPGNRVLVQHFQQKNESRFAIGIAEDFNSLWQGENLRSYSAVPARPRALSIDLDGTLLSGQETPPDFEYLDLVENYLRALKNHLRIPVIACTGRSRAFVEGICNARFAGCFSGFVFENGCVAVPKPDASLTNLVDLENNNRAVQLIAFIERLLHDWGVQFERCKEYLLTFKAEDLAGHRDFIFSLLDNPDLTVCPALDKEKSKGRYDVMPSGISKLTGVMVLLNEGAPRNRFDISTLLHIGDDSNDVELLSKAGWKGLVPVRDTRKLSPGLQRIWEENVNESTVFCAKEPVARGAYEILVGAFGSFFLH